VPSSTKKLVITDLVISVDTAMAVTFYVGDTTTVADGPYYLPANGTLQITPRAKFKLATAGVALYCKTSAAGNITVTPYYTSET
jgi:hypothetical protein